MKKSIKQLMVLSALFMVGTVASGCGNSSSVPTSAPASTTSQEPSSQGHTAFTGHGAPSADLGEDGDTYTDLDTDKMYRKENGQWVLVSNPNPKNYSGEGEPDPSLGENGDKYTNTLNGAEYEKQNGQWVKTKEGDAMYTVTFNLNGGHWADGSTTYPAQTVREGRWIKAPTSEPLKDNCTFLGWFAEGSDTKWNFTGTGVYGNVALVAHWKVNEDQKVVVLIDPNNGNDTYEYEGYVGEHYYPSIPDYPGYNFLGWYVESTGEKYTGTISAVLATTTLVAHWEKANFNVAYRVEENDEVTITGILNVETVSITVPNVINGRRVTKIAKTAFQNRVKLESINLGSNIATIEDGAFRGTWRLRMITVDSSNLNFVSVEGVVYTKDMTELVCFPTQNGTSYTCPSTLKKIGAYAFAEGKDMGITSITMNEGLEVIGEGAFYQNELLTAITLPNTLKRIEAKAFYGPVNASDEDDYISPQGVLTNANLPDSLEYIGEMAFANQYFKETFTITNNVKEIGAYAFANCTAIEKIVIGKNVETIGYNAFAGCTGILEVSVADGCLNFSTEDKVLYNKEKTKLIFCPSGRTETVAVPEGVTELGDCAFYMVDRLEGIELPSTLKKIGEECFAQTYEISSFEIPNSVEEMGEDCFFCSGITSVTIGTGLKAIPAGCFDSTKLSSVEIPGNVETIGESAFSHTPLANLTLNEGLIEIEKYAFSSTSVATLNMPNSLETIGESAFAASKVKALNIKDGLVNLGANAFVGVDSSGYMSVVLSSVTVSDGNAKFAAKDGILYSKDLKTLYGATTAAGVADGTSYTVTIPSGVEIIADWAFSGCKNFKTISVPDTVKEIGMGSFYRCSFSEFAIPASCTKIGEGAFNGNYSLETVNFNSVLEEIGPYAFSYTWLAGADLPDSLKKIGQNAFSNNTNLKSAHLGSGLEEIGDFAFADNKIASEIHIGSGLTKIGEGAFASTISTYGQSITRFSVDAGNPKYATDDKGALLMSKDKTVIYGLAGAKADVTIPTTVTEIANYGMAANQNKVTNLAIPYSVEKIGENAFLGLTKVGTMRIPSTVQYIGAYAFHYWLTSQTVSFYCTLEYALSHFHQYFNVGGSCSFIYEQE